MSGEVIKLRAAQGPPETDFEREAVDTLLGSLRQFKAVSKGDPQAVIFAVLREDDTRSYHRISWYTRASHMPFGLFAWAAALLTKRATGDA